jgi:hypothetical protein
MSIRLLRKYYRSYRHSETYILLDHGLPPLDFVQLRSIAGTQGRLVEVVGEEEEEAGELLAMNCWTFLICPFEEVHHCALMYGVLRPSVVSSV